MYYRESDNALKKFQVNIASFADSVNNSNYGDTEHGTLNWLTPVAGSGYTFDPVDFYQVWAEKIIYTSSIGLGFATWEGGKLRMIKFPWGYARWDATKADLQVSSVPEPGSLALLLFGLLGIATGQQMRKKPNQ